MKGHLYLELTPVTSLTHTRWESGFGKDSPRIKALGKIAWGKVSKSVRFV